jgi:hypothetical protein
MVVNGPESEWQVGSDVHGPASSHGPGQSHGLTMALAWLEIQESQSHQLRPWLLSDFLGPQGSV